MRMAVGFAALAAWAILALPAWGGTGLEGRTYRYPGAPAREPAPEDEPLTPDWPVIASDWYYEGSFRFELSVAYDGAAYYLTGTITNADAAPAGLSYANPGALPYFRVVAGDQTVWSTRRSGPAAQMVVSHELQPGAALEYRATWTGQDREGYAVAPGAVVIEFAQTNFGWSGTDAVCCEVPLLPAGTAWLQEGLQAGVDSWEAELLDSFIAHGALPGYPAEYFTTSARRGREVAMAAAVLISDPVADKLTREQQELARQLADTVGL